MTKPVLPRPTGSVQIDLAAYEQWQHLVALLTAAQQTSTESQVTFDVAKLETALTYGLQLTTPGVTAKIATGADLLKQTTPQDSTEWQSDQIYHYTVWPRVEGGADLIWKDGKSGIKCGLLTETELRQLRLKAGDVVTAVINQAKQVHEVQLIDHVVVETGLVMLAQAVVEAGDVAGLPGHLVVTHNATTVLTDGSGMPYPYVVPQSVVSQYDLQVGDRVDLRWYQDELMTMRLIWRYPR